MTASSESSSTPVSPVPVASDLQPVTPAFFVSDSLRKNLNLAALGGMAAAVLSYLSLMVHLGLPVALLIYAGKVMMYWGLLQVGRHYQLSWVSRGCTLLLLTKMIELLPLFNAHSASFINWLTGILWAIGAVVAFTDLWGLRHVLRSGLVTAVVLGFIGEQFVSATELFDQPTFYLLKSVNVGLLACLFYAISARKSPSPSDEGALISPPAQ